MRLYINFSFIYKVFIVEVNNIFSLVHHFFSVLYLKNIASHSHQINYTNA